MTGGRKLTLEGPFSTQLSQKEGSNLCVGFPNLFLSYKNLILSMNEFIYSYQLQVSNFSLLFPITEDRRELVFNMFSCFSHFARQVEGKGKGLAIESCLHCTLPLQH